MANYLTARSVFIAGALAGIVWVASSQTSDANRWSMAGHDLNNSRSQPNEHILTTDNVQNLVTKWTFTTGADVSATPAVFGGTVYVPDWAGNLYAVNAADGTMLWSHQVADYDKFLGAIARVTPAVHGNDIIIGDVQSTDQPHNGANIMAVDRSSGALHWIAKVDSHPAALITGSPVVAGDTVYVGVSSSEETLAVQSTYPCCSFRGSIVALDANTGQILWQRFTVPKNSGMADGYSGGAVWQPPAIDQARDLLYIGTGNNYEVPSSVKACLQDTPTDQQFGCFAENDHFDSVMALHLKTGAIKWSKRLQGVDVWTVACVKNPNPVACPEPDSPDYDFSGSGPNLIGDMVGFGQKSGMYWALHAATGNILWNTMVGPGATLGGIEWGTATDGQRIYVAISNGAHKVYPLIGGTSTMGGAWSALDVKTGKILWQTADPMDQMDVGAVSLANGVMFAPSFSGNVYALNGATGKILWSFASGGSVIDGPSIVDGIVYWGSGYKHIMPGMPNNQLFAFKLSGS